MTTRSGLPAAWLTCHARAAVDLLRHGYEGASGLVVERVAAAGQHWHDARDDVSAQHRWQLATLADIAETVGRLVDPAAHPEGLGLVFSDADTGEIVDPAVFQDDDAGRAIVWASRLTSAALHGDTATVTALADVLQRPLDGDTDAKPISYVGVLVKAVGPLIALQVDRDNLNDLQAGGVTNYVWRCDDCGNVGVAGQRDARDLAAAEHVLHHAHVVAHKTTWATS